MPSKNQHVHEVFAEWSLYEKIIHFNYMCHREMISAIQQAVTEIDQPLHVLDLGCGDGGMASRGLAGADVALYIGVDLSESALQSVKGNLASVTDNVTLQADSIAGYLNDANSSKVNLILASYSLHHYVEQEQPKIIELCAKRLHSNGGLIWIDLCKANAESRDEYLRRFWSTTLPRWDELSESQGQEVIDHMRDSDFPLALDERSEVALQRGFDSRTSLFQNEFYAADYFGKTMGQDDVNTVLTIPD